MMDGKTIKKKLRGLTLEEIKLLRKIVDDEIRRKESQENKMTYKLRLRDIPFYVFYKLFDEGW